jgi:hypothetical protein
MCIICEYIEKYNNSNQITTLNEFLKEKLKGIKELNCSFCSQIKEIPVITKLQKLLCSNCPLLREIPVITGLQKLWCDNCQQLREIPVITELQNLLCYIAH